MLIKNTNLRDALSNTGKLDLIKRYLGKGFCNKLDHVIVVHDLVNIPFVIGA